MRVTIMTMRMRLLLLLLLLLLLMMILMMMFHAQSTITVISGRWWRWWWWWWWWWIGRTAFYDIHCWCCSNVPVPAGVAELSAENGLATACGPICIASLCHTQSTAHVRQPHKAQSLFCMQFTDTPLASRKHACKKSSGIYTCHKLPEFINTIRLNVRRQSWIAEEKEPDLWKSRNRTSEVKRSGACMAQYHETTAENWGLVTLPLSFALSSDNGHGRSVSLKSSFTHTSRWPLSRLLTLSTIWALGPDVIRLNENKAAKRLFLH